MNDHTSPLSQRVRRLLGTNALAADLSPPQLPDTPPISDTGALFESQIGRLSSALRDLRAIDRQRDAELRALRERLAIVEELHRHVTVQQIAPLIRRLDALVDEAARLLQPAPEPSPSATLFERMRAQAAARDPELTHRTALMAWASSLADIRAQLAAIIEE